MKLKNIFRSAWFQMRQQPVLSIVTVAGTALSIFLIMIVVMMQEVTTAPFAPESNRDRFLHYRHLSTTFADSGQSNGPMSYQTAKQMLLSLTSPETATAYQAYLTTGAMSVAKGPNFKVDIRPADNNFWKVFDFTFINGAPFTQADFDASLSKIVITESVARQLFGTSEAAGKEILLNLAPFTVAGVVKDVSTLASSSYAQAWPNLSATATIDDVWSNIHGYLSVTLLARSRDDFGKIHEEYQKLHDKYEEEIKPTGMTIRSLGRPYDQEANAIAFSASSEPDVAGERRNRFIVYLILLIVPAINLSAMTQSRLKQRTAEIAVRRSFGCKRSRIIFDIITENLIITLVAGILGLIMSVIFGYLCNSLLFAQPYSETINPPVVDSSILLHWSTFAWAMIFCFILNILSSGLPAINAARTPLANALNSRSN